MAIPLLATVCFVLALLFFFWASFRKVLWVDQTAFGLFWLTLSIFFSGTVFRLLLS